ncbi:MAG TPA: hypothetical protein VFM32_02220 [Spongiibacteraceae bacterium]|nr:hypothetical protein [Spongiibacteraceae bacterium]
MQCKMLLKLFQYGALSTVMLMGLTAVAHGDESQPAQNQPESTQPAQQATPTQPTAEPEKSDNYEETALV